MMGDSLCCNRSSDKRDFGRIVASGPKAVWQTAFKHVASLSHATIWGNPAGYMALFFIKVATLEMMRRFSRAKCPFVWQGLQAFQVLCYPPFKWIQRWGPLKGLVHMQTVSKPLLALSIATVFSDESDHRNGSSGDRTGSHLHLKQQPELSSVQPISDFRAVDETQYPRSENWLVKLREELERQGLDLPERINDEELHRFYSAANGDFDSLLSLVKKTIHWRGTYRIFSEEELKTWSNFVFWHGYDLHRRPCLVIRLGLACLSLPSKDKPRLAQAIISQVEHAASHLVDLENPRITVLVDCEGLSPLRVPMKSLRACSSHLQDHFPNRLGCLFVIRLPPVVRVIAQTFIQVLKPSTRQKLRVEGGMYKKTLLEYLPTLPSCLGGQCACVRCSNKNLQSTQQSSRSVINKIEPAADSPNGENLHMPNTQYGIDFHSNVSCDQVLRTAIIGVLMLWLFMAVIEGICDPESRSFLSSRNAVEIRSSWSSHTLIEKKLQRAVGSPSQRRNLQLLFADIALEVDDRARDIILSGEEDAVSPADDVRKGPLCFYDVLADHYVQSPDTGKPILNLIVQLWSQSFASHIFTVLFHKWLFEVQLDNSEVLLRYSSALVQGATNVFWIDIQSNSRRFQSLFYYLIEEVASEPRQLNKIPVQAQRELFLLLSRFILFYNLDDKLETFLSHFPGFPNAFLVGGPADFFVTEVADQLQKLKVEPVLLHYLSHMKILQGTELGMATSTRLKTCLYSFTSPGGPMYPTRAVRHAAWDTLDSLFPVGRYPRHLISSFFRLLYPWYWPSSCWNFVMSCITAIFYSVLRLIFSSWEKLRHPKNI